MEAAVMSLFESAFIIWNGLVRMLASVIAIEDDTEAVKAEIIGKGAVFALYYSYPLYYNDFVNDRGDSSYYMPYSVDSKNHAISIVGWDDDFPAEAFAKDFVRDNKDGEIVDETLPNGAWLIKNSWGKRAYKTPDEVYEKGKRDGTLRTDLTEDKMFATTSHIMMAVGGRYAQGLLFASENEADRSEEYELLRRMILREFVIEK